MAFPRENLGRVAYAEAAHGVREAFLEADHRIKELLQRHLRERRHPLPRGLGHSGLREDFLDAVPVEERNLRHVLDAAREDDFRFACRDEACGLHHGLDARAGHRLDSGRAAEVDGGDAREVGAGARERRARSVDDECGFAHWGLLLRLAATFKESPGAAKPRSSVPTSCFASAIGFFSPDSSHSQRISSAAPKRMRTARRGSRLRRTSPLAMPARRTSARSRKYSTSLLREKRSTSRALRRSTIWHTAARAR